jgi:type VI protein secretion system component VasK
VWQTLGVCVLIVIVEIAWPTLDPHWFWLLVLLTVYSAITQPALAQATSVQTEQLRLIEERQNKELKELNELLTDVHEILRELEDSQRKTDKDHW